MQEDAMADKPIFLYVATYGSDSDAKADEEVVKQLYHDKIIGTYDAAVVNKDAEGKVHIKRTEKPTEHGAEIGAVAGIVAGVLFPPFLLVDAAIGAVAGGLIGHFRKGMAHKDLQEVGDLLNDSSAALIVVGESRLDEALNKELKRATKQVEKQLMVDTKEFNKELDDAMKQATAAQ
jgi:uncharacterized membrane protein